MSNHAWILLGLFLVVLLLTVKPLGTYIANVMEGRFRLAGKIESPIYRLCGIRQDEEMGWLKYAFAILLFNVLGVLGGLCPAAPASLAAAQSAGVGQCQPGLRLQHGDQLRHQHQLAGLWRRIDHELPDPDAGAGGAELPVGRHRHRRRHRPDPRFCPPHGQDRRQRLGRSDPHHAATSCCRSPSFTRSS